MKKAIKPTKTAKGKKVNKMMQDWKSGKGKGGRTAP